MVTDDLPRALDQLAFLGRSREVSIRPVLLRVMVDMFLHKPHHTDIELKQFEEMLTHLLEDADPHARRDAAEKLSRHPQTPRALLDILKAEYDGQRQPSPDGDANIASLAASLDLDDGATPGVRSGTTRGGASLSTGAHRGDGDALARPLPNRPSAMDDPATSFLTADPAQRIQMIAEARRRDLGMTGRTLPVAFSPDCLTAIERASWQSGVEGLEVALAISLGLSVDEVHAIMDDPHGEPLALALAAVGVPGPTAARIFILGGPTLGHSYFAIKALVGIVQSVPPRTAFRLVWTMVGRLLDTPRRAPATADTRRSAGSGVRVEAAAGTDATAAPKAAGRRTG